jgi:hypothetical protein
MPRWRELRLGGRRHWMGSASVALPAPRAAWCRRRTESCGAGPERQAKEACRQARRRERPSRCPPLGTSAAADRSWGANLSGRGVDDHGDDTEHREGMTADHIDLAMPAPSEDLTDAVTAYLSRHKGLTLEHTQSDLRVFLT